MPLLAQELGRAMSTRTLSLKLARVKEYSALFADFGEARFRALEAAVVGEISLHAGSKGNPRVVSLGGGVLSDKNLELLSTSGTLILSTGYSRHLA